MITIESTEEIRDGGPALAYFLACCFRALGFGLAVIAVLLSFLSWWLGGQQDAAR